MNKYWRLLVFGKPYLGRMALVLLLAYLYIVFNLATYWYSADFFQTIFLKPAETASGPALAPGSAPEAAPAATPGAPSIVTSTVPSTVPSMVTSNTAPGVTPETSAPELPAAPDSPAKIGPLPVSGSSFSNRIKAKTDLLVQGRDKRETLLRVCLVLAVCFVLKNVATYFRGILMASIELHIVSDIRNRLFTHLMRLPLSFFGNRKSGDITSIMVNDVGVINNVISVSFKDLVLVPAELLVSLVALFLISWKLSVIICVVIPLLGLIISWIGSSVRRKSLRTLLGISSVVDCLQEVVPSIKIVKAYGTEAKETDRFRRLNSIFYRLSFRQKRLQNLTSPANEVIAVCLAVYLLWYGGNQVLSGNGLEPVMFVRYLVFLFAMFQPLRQLSGLNNAIQPGIAAGDRVYEILNEVPETDSGTRVLAGFERDLVFDNVTFRYAPHLPPVLQDIRLQIPKGSVVAFVGPSGAGKTSLVSLIPRFFEVESGRILIDGVDIRDCSLASLRRQVSVVTQETILFNMTIAENIAYSSDAVDMARVEEAARVANAEEFVRSAPNGYESVVGERGVRLSGGQRQRLSIARAMLKNTPILILDEATSSLDTESEHLVQEAIDSLMKNRTVLVIAHRLSTVIHADTIVVMDQGRILDSGRHRDLLERCPLYRKLYDMQFRDE